MKKYLLATTLFFGMVSSCFGSDTPPPGYRTVESVPYYTTTESIDIDEVGSNEEWVGVKKRLSEMTPEERESFVVEMDVAEEFLVEGPVRGQIKTESWCNPRGGTVTGPAGYVYQKANEHDCNPYIIDPTAAGSYVPMRYRYVDNK